MKISQDTIGFLISDVSRLMRREFEKRLEGSSLTLAQGRALVNVARHEGVRQIDLADLLEVQPITMARLIDQLVDAGLVERRADPADRRAYLIFLTPAAAPHLDAIAKVGADIRADVLTGLSEQQVAVLFDALRSMRDRLTRRGCGNDNKSGDQA